MADSDFGPGSAAQMAQDTAKQIQSNYGNQFGGQGAQQSQNTARNPAADQLNTPYPDKGGK